MRVLAVLLAFLSAPAWAQTNTRPDAARPVEAVREAVGRLFDGMRARDSAAVAAVFHPEGRLHTVVRTGEGGYRLAETPLPAFLAAVAAAPDVLDERTGEIDVRVDDGLATAWMAYRFYVGDRFSHCGVNAMQFVLHEGTWKLLHVVDTRRQGCK